MKDALLQDRLSIHDVVDGNTEYLEEYLKIYTGYLPQYARYVPVMRQRAESPVDIDGLERWHQWLVKLDDKPAAMVGFLYNRKRNLGILMDFAVAEDFRELTLPKQDRFAGKLLYHAMEQLKSDAAEIGNPPPLCMAAEVEHIPLVERYKEYGFVEFPIEYYEPPGTPELASLVKPDDIEQIGYRRLYLGAFRMPGSEFSSIAVGVVDIIIRALLEDHYRLPKDHWLLEKVSQSIQLGDVLP